jgi:hypothetical protein
MLRNVTNVNLNSQETANKRNSNSEHTFFECVPCCFTYHFFPTPSTPSLPALFSPFLATVFLFLVHASHRIFYFLNIPHFFFLNHLHQLILNTKVTALWDVAPRSLVYISRRFRGAYCFHHHHHLITDLFLSVLIPKLFVSHLFHTCCTPYPIHRRLFNHSSGVW